MTKSSKRLKPGAVVWKISPRFRPSPDNQLRNGSLHYSQEISDQFGYLETKFGRFGHLCRVSSLWSSMAGLMARERLE